MNAILRTLQVSILVLGVFTFCLLGAGCGKKDRPAPSAALQPPSPATVQQQSVEAPPPTPEREVSAEPEWGVAAHFGMITTVWISDQALRDKFQVAQILHQVDRNHGKGAVWFFNSRQHAPEGVPMTDQQMLHWVGLYDPAQSETFLYVEVSDRSASPPETKMIKTTIRPGYAE